MNNSIADLGTDIASKMLSALTMEGGEIDPVKENISIEEQKRYLKRYIDILSISDRKSIGDILVMNNKRNLLFPCAEGTVINLDNLPTFIIEQMYELMLYKINRRE